MRSLPWLTAVAFLAGLCTFVILTLRDWRLLEASGMASVPFAEAVHIESIRMLWLEFLRAHWITGTLCLLPSAALAMFRLRREALILPVAVACFWFTIYWIGSDLLQNLHRTLHDPLGMEPSPAAYLTQLILMAAALLSPPLLMALYYGSSMLDRYLLRNFAAPFAVCLGGISAIMVTMDLLNNANDFASAGYSAWRVVLFYIGQSPRILVVITESALLLATLYSLGKMSRHNELTAMISAGRSVFRVLLPVLVCGLWCSLAVLAMNYQLAPETKRMREETLGEAGSKLAKDTAVYNVLYRNRDGLRTWYLHRVPYNLREDSPMSDVYVWQQDAAGNIMEAFFARQALWVPETGVWRFSALVRYDFVDPSSGRQLDHPRRRELTSLSVEKSTWPETPGGMLSDKFDPDYLGVPGLLSALKSRTTLPEKVRARYLTALQWRFALPFRSFLMVLFAAPLGIVASRRNMLGGVSVAFGIFTLVYFLSIMFLKAGEGSYLPPFLGAWGVNLLFAVTGVCLFWSRSRNRAAPSLNPLRWFRRTA